LTVIAAPRASTISSCVAPALMAAEVWMVMHPSQRKFTAAANAINSRIFFSSPAPGVQVAGLSGGFGQAAVASDDLRRCAADFANAGQHFPLVLVPIEHHCADLHCNDKCEVRMNCGAGAEVRSADFGRVCLAGAMIKNI
jgi:hypothetical protein